MSEQLLNTFGKRVRALRGEMTQEELLERAEKECGQSMSQGHWSSLERKGKIPNGGMVAAVAKVLGVSADYLLLITDNPYPSHETKDIDAISEEAEEVAGIIDEMTPERRQDVLAIVRALDERDKIPKSLARRYDMILNSIQEIGGDDEVFAAIQDLSRREAALAGRSSSTQKKAT